MATELRALLLLLLCFPGLQGQILNAKRREGDSLSIQCSYAGRTYDSDTKYWCRWTGGTCKESLQTYYNYKQSRDGKMTIQDDTTRKTVSITMTDLKAEDSGAYACAYYASAYRPLVIISLDVFKELLRWELDTVSVQCPLPSRVSSVTWCRREGQTQCTDLLETRTPATRSRASKSQQARIELIAEQGILTATMKKLQTSDTGVYWCALGPYRTRIMEVVLSVFTRTQQYTAKESANISVQCHYKIADYSTVSKAWCKKEAGKPCNVLVTTSSEPPGGHGTAREGSVRIQDDTQQGTVTITMEQLQAQDSGVYWCVLHEPSGLSRMEEVTLSVSKALPSGDIADTESKNQEIILGNSPEPSSNENTFLILTVVLLILLVLALIASTTLAVRHSKLLGRTGNRAAEDTSDRPEGTAQPGSTGRRESSQNDINLDVQAHSSPEDPVYCNVEPSQAPRKPQSVEYAVIAFNQSPRNDWE